ncbi:MAG TPA: hypothetical protein VFO70_05465 [Chitinophagaceae bacterium]|nr:hypothetical protein [Chitinophagaceae bacterium]
MNVFKRILGIIWFIIAPVIVYMLVDGAIGNIDPSGTKDINYPVIWVIIIAIFTPIGIGLMIFGWYAFKGEYDHLPEDSGEL